MSPAIRSCRRARWTSKARLSAALEDGLALLLERLRPFLCVLGHRGRNADLLLLLERLRGREAEARHDRALDRLHGERAVLADELRVAARLAHDLRRRPDLVHEPDSERLGGGELLARQQDRHPLR